MNHLQFTRIDADFCGLLAGPHGRVGCDLGKQKQAQVNSPAPVCQGQALCLPRGATTRVAPTASLIIGSRGRMAPGWSCCRPL